MAHLYRPTIVRYVGPDGKRCKKSDASARKKREKSKVWRGVFKDKDGIEVDEALCENKDLARQMLSDRERRGMHRKAGMFDAFEEHRKRPLLCPKCKSVGSYTRDGRSASRASARPNRT